MSSTIMLSAKQAHLIHTLTFLTQLQHHPNEFLHKKLTRPAHYFKVTMLRTLEKLYRKSLAREASKAEKSIEKPLLKQADLRHFRFHPSTRLLAKQGYYASAYRLSLARTIKDAARFPLRQTQLHAFAPKPCNIMVGMDKYGTRYIHAFQPMSADSQLYRVTEAQPVIDHSLRQGLRRRMRHAAPAGVALAKAFMQPSAKFEVFIDRSYTVYLQQFDGEYLTLDTLDNSFKAANVSANGRFVGLITADGRVRRYDNEQNDTQEFDLSGDNEAITISVANDGTLYIGSHQHTYLIPAHSENALQQGPGLGPDNTFFGLSVDERFLISPSHHKRGKKKSEILLTDLQNAGQTIILSSAQTSTLSYSRPHSIAFSQLNALVAVGYQNGLIEIFVLIDRACQAYAPLLTSCTVPQYSALPPCPLVSFAQGFDQLHVCYRGRGNAVELSTLTFGLARETST